MHERLPLTFKDQLATLPPRSEMDKITCRLNVTVVNTMNNADIPFILTEWRTKTRESMGWKDGPEPKTQPFIDIHGVRIVLESEYKDRTIKLLQEVIPTPNTFPWGIRTIRHLGNPPKFDALAKHEYSGTHINLFLPNGARYAEVQLHTPEEYVAAEILRPQYDAFKKSVGENY